MSNLNVSYDAMKDAAGRLNVGREDLLGKLVELQGVINGLISQGFQTDAAGPAYQSAYDNFTKGTQTAVAGLEGLAQFLNAAAETYGNADSELARGISQ